MSRRLQKVLFYGATVPLWMGACCFLVEAGNSFITRNGVVDGHVSPIISQAENQDMAVYDATAAGAPRPPAEVAEKYPVLGALDRASEAGLRELAKKWDGVIFQCDTKGKLGTRYFPPDSPLAALFAAKTASAAYVSEIPPNDQPKYGADIADRLKASLEEWRNPQPRQPHMVGCIGPTVDYGIPLPDYPGAGFRFMFRPVAVPGRLEPDVLMVAVPWRWEAFGGGFRPNYYESDAYPQFPKSDFWTNSRGFRDVEVAVPKPKGVYRIVCIGGSTTVEGPRNDLTYPEMLERLLRAHFHTDAIDVVNCGVDGGSMRGQGLRFDECLALNPDLVIHYNFVNDTHDLINNVLKRTVARAAFSRGIVGVLARSSFVTRRCRRVWSGVMPCESDYRAEIERILMPPLEDLRARAEQAGARFAVSSFGYPDIDNIPPMERAWFRNHYWFSSVIKVELDDYALAADAFNCAARAFCERKGALYVPVAEEISGGLETFTDHCHMHVGGIRHKAQIMFEHLSGVIAKDLAVLKQAGTASQP